MGVYGLISGRVYGRSWSKYLGGWIYKNSDNKNYYYGYTMMYIIAGLIMLFVGVVMSSSTAYIL